MVDWQPERWPIKHTTFMTYSVEVAELEPEQALQRQRREELTTSQAKRQERMRQSVDRQHLKADCTALKICQESLQTNHVVGKDQSVLR